MWHKTTCATSEKLNMKKAGRTILKICEWGIFLVILVVFAAIFSPFIPNGHFKSYTVVSGSMQPAIMTGSLAFIKPVSTPLKVGEVIAFSEPQSPKNTILHRIHSIKGTGNNEIIHTKGDANHTVDNWNVTRRDVRGMFLFSIPLIGYISEFIRKPLGFILLIGIPALVIILLQAKMIKNGFEEEIKKRSSGKNGNHLGAYSKELVLLIVLLAGLALPRIYSLLSSSATISGLTIQTKPTFAEIKPTFSGHYVDLEITNITSYSTISYELKYDTDSISQDVKGQDILDGSSYQKNILLGSCSSNGACTYDSNPHNFVLTTTLTDTNGKSTTITSEF